jgi:amidohydrolase
MPAKGSLTSAGRGETTEGAVLSNRVVAFDVIRQSATETGADRTGDRRQLIIWPNGEVTRKGGQRMSELLAAARERAGQLVDWRRYLHAHPELSGEEARTSAFVAERLRALGLEPEVGVGETHGVTARIEAGRGPAIALRADMDALPIDEENEIPYRSTRPGAMHACGHDAHTAMLLGAAELLSARRASLRRPVRFVFQPSEERWPGGAAPMIRAGVLADCDRAFGIHIWSEMPTGTIGTRPGPFMSSARDLRILVRGKGGHAAMPQQCIDPVVVAAQLVVALQTVVSRSIAMYESGVVSVTMVRAGSAGNVIPPDAELRGTVRTLSEAVFETVRTRIESVAAGIGQAFGATIEVDMSDGYPALVNDAGMVAAACEAARKVGIADSGVLTLPPQGGGEDFAYFAEAVPAAFVFVGARDEASDCCYPHHHPRFNVDERALPIGAALLAQVALDSPASDV